MACTAILLRGAGTVATLGIALLAQAPEVGSGESELLRRFDTAFSAGDEKAFFACFATDAPTHALDAWRARWRALAPESRAIQRRSVPIHAGEITGARTLIVRVEYRDPAHEEFPVCIQEERWVFAAGSLTDHLRLCVDHDGDFDRRLVAGAGVWSCPPCAFQMQTPKGWLAVPTRSLEILCLDAATYYHPALDLALEIGVQVVAGNAGAKAVLEGVLAALGAKASGERPVESWCPLQFVATERPEWIDGARVQVELDARRAVDARTIAYGRLAFVLTAYGPAALLRAHADELERAFSGFRLDATIGPDELVARARAHHGGGATFDAAGHFVHPQLGIRVPIAADWHHELLAGQQLCGAIAWDAQTKSRVRVTALPPPRGFQQWSLLLADRALQRTAGTWLASARDSGWVTAAGRQPRRTLVGLSEAGVCGLCAIQRHDVFLVVQWEACSPGCRASIEKLLDAVELR